MKRTQSDQIKDRLNPNVNHWCRWRQDNITAQHSYSVNRNIELQSAVSCAIVHVLPTKKYLKSRAFFKGGGFKKNQGILNLLVHQIEIYLKIPGLYQYMSNVRTLEPKNMMNHELALKYMYLIHRNDITLHWNMSDIKSHPLDVIQRDTIAKFLLLSKYMKK